MHPFALEYPTGNGESEMRQKKNLARVWKKVELIKVFTLQYECNSNHAFPFDILFHQITTFIKVLVAFVFELQTL